MGWKCTPLDQPPRDGSWFIMPHDDGSGAAIWAWYEDEHGGEGWHDCDGRFDGGDTDFPPGQVWAELPKFFAERIIDNMTADGAPPVV